MQKSINRSKVIFTAL